MFNDFRRIFFYHNNNRNIHEKQVKISAIHIRFITALFILIGLCPSLHAQTNISLHDSLNAAIEKQSSERLKQSLESDAQQTYVAWLDGAPSISLMYLDSQQSAGTTESEISLNLPIKSSFLKQVEKTLGSKVESLRLSANQQYALYLSGIIRDLLWQVQIETATLTSVARKQALLEDLALQYQDMAQLQAIPQYVSLMVQKEVNDQKIAYFQHQHNIKNLRAKYYSLTGLQILPENIVEAPPKPNQSNINAHPDVLALDAAFESTQQSLLSVSNKAQAWNVQLTGKRVETGGFSENQLGIGLEVPITIGNQLSSLQQSENIKASTEYQIARSKLMHQLTQAQADLLQELVFLQHKQNLLSEGLPTLSALKLTMEDLREANAPNQEFYLRTLLDTIDAEQAIEINQVRIQRQIALINQAAGITL